MNSAERFSRLKLRRKITLCLVATILLAISIVVASHPQAAVSHAKDYSANSNGKMSGRNSATPAGASSRFTSLVSGADTPNATAQASNGRIYFNGDRDGNPEIYAMNADGSLQTRITNNPAVDADPAWSSANQKIAFVSNRDGGFQIYTMSGDGGSQTRISNNSADDGSPAWSPNGQKIAFASDRDGNYEIYAMNPTGSFQTRLSFNSATDVNPSWSPDGSKIAFESNRDGNFEIYTMNADGSAQTRLTTNLADDEFPAWSPDGTKILFASMRDGDQEIYEMNSDGSNQTRLTSNPGSDGLPAWSPDGTKIAFESNRDGNFQIYTMNADGSNQIRLTNNSATEENPTWSDLTPTPASTHSIAGRVSEDGNGLSGVTLNLSGTRNASVFSDANGNYSFSNLPGGGNYTISASKTSYAFTPASRSFNNLSADQSSADFAATRMGFSIQVRAYRAAVGFTLGVPDIPVTLSGSTSATGFTNANGLISFDHLQPGGNYTVTPTPPDGFRFIPASQVITNLMSDQQVQFERVPIYRVSGRVADTRGNGIAGVTISLGIQLDPPFIYLTTVTDANGNYSFEFVPADIRFSYDMIYAVYPSKAGYSFSPILYRTVAGVDIPGISIGIIRRNQPFAAVANFFPTNRISGRVTDSTGAVSGVTLTLSGQGSAVATSDSNGNYSFANLAAGNDYTITPSKTGLVFLPSNRSFTSLSADQVGVNFGAQQSNAGFEPVVLTTDQVALKTWTFQGRTYAYVRLSFPKAGYRVANWGQAVRSADDFSADAAVERSTGESVEAVTTTAQIYDLGPLADGNYTFAFKNSGAVVKSQAFSVNSAVQPPNPIDNAREFVRQQYRDFLNREADQAGEDFWTDNITKCSDPARRPAGQTEAQCTQRQRETTSAAFFLSPEFQYTGYYVYRMYQGALGRPPKLSEFIPDVQFVANGIIVNGQLSAAKINQNKAAFAQQFENCVDPAKYRCAEFKARYNGLDNRRYVDKLFQTTGVNASDSDRVDLVNAIGANQTRASVLQKIVDGVNVISEGNQQFTTTYGKAFYDQQFNRAFVQLEYFGYLKRDPDDAGYTFWLGKLNQFGGNFVNAEMVLAFISSPEYRARFGQP